MLHVDYLPSDKKEETLKIYNQSLPIHARTLARMRFGEAGSEKFVDDVQKYYFNGKPVCEETIPALVQMITDSYFGIPAAVMLENRVKWASAPAYFFRYSYVGNERTSTDRLVKRVMRGNCALKFLTRYVIRKSYLYAQILCSLSF